MTVSEAYEILYTGVIIGLLVLSGVMLVRAIKGPGITDRIVSVNMIGTMVVCIIAVCSMLLQESYLVDVALIYTMISFVAVMMMGMMYISPDVKRDKKKKGQKKHPSGRQEDKD